MTLVPWALGGWAVYVTSAQYSGLGFVESYMAFQGGSNLGNVLWFAVWSLVAALVCGFLSRRTTSADGAMQFISRVLYCYGTPATLLLFPDAAMGFAVSHVRVFSDSTAPHSPVVEFLVVTGAIAIVCAAALSILIHVRNRHRPASAAGH